MIYPLRSKPKQKYSWKIISIILFFILISSIVYLFPNATRSFSYTVSLPFWSVRQSVTQSFSKTKEYFVFKNSLVNKNTALEDEISLLRSKEIDYDILLKENQDLKNQLGRKGGAVRILAKVLSKPPRSPYDTFVLDIGSNQEVALGNKVYTSDNVIIGVIKNITPRTSLVELFSSGSSKQEAVLSRTGTNFTLVGRGGANFVLEVPKDTDILWGDIFMYSTLSSSIIGSVYYIDTNSQSAFKTAYIKVPGNVFSSDWVQVEK